MRGGVGIKEERGGRDRRGKGKWVKG